MIGKIESGVGEEIVGGKCLKKIESLKKEEIIRNIGGKEKVMGWDKNGCELMWKIDKKIKKLRWKLRIKRRGRLIEKKKEGRGRKRKRNRDEMLMKEGKSRRKGIGIVRNEKIGEKLNRKLKSIVIWKFKESEKKLNEVMDWGMVREKMEIMKKNESMEENGLYSMKDWIEVRIEGDDMKKKKKCEGGWYLKKVDEEKKGDIEEEGWEKERSKSELGNSDVYVVKDKGVVEKI